MFTTPKAECCVFHYSNNSTWVQVRGWPRFPSVDVICMAKPVLSAAWLETPTAPGMDIRAHATSLHPKGDADLLICQVAVAVLHK